MELVEQKCMTVGLLLSMYINLLSAIIDSHSIIHHSFSDDLQLQISAPLDKI